MVNYYEILQVHPKAEPEVIEAAYKKLAFKYHPDQQGSEDIMKNLNLAYEVLGHPEKRKHYDSTFSFESSDTRPKKTYKANATNERLAKRVLSEYFRMLQQRHFKEAYDMMTLVDQKKINLKDFMKWQGAVSKVFELRAFELKHSKSHSNVCLNGERYQHIETFEVVTEEWNSIMDTHEKDAFEKQVVLEQGRFKIYMGIEVIYKLIEKYENLSQLLELKNGWGMKDKALRPILSERLFFYSVFQEQKRVERYGGGFSILLISADSDTVHKREWIGNWVKKSLRQVDTIGYDKQGHLVVMMPETPLVGAIKAGEKLKKGLERFTHNAKGIICVEAFQGSIEKTMQGLYHLKHQHIQKKGIVLAFNRKMR